MPLEAIQNVLTEWRVDGQGERRQPGWLAGLFWMGMNRLSELSMTGAMEDLMGGTRRIPPSDEEEARCARAYRQARPGLGARGGRACSKQGVSHWQGPRPQVPLPMACGRSPWRAVGTKGPIGRPTGPIADGPAPSGDSARFRRGRVGRGVKGARRRCSLPHFGRRRSANDEAASGCCDQWAPTGGCWGTVGFMPLTGSAASGRACLLTGTLTGSRACRMALGWLSSTRRRAARLLVPLIEYTVNDPTRPGHAHPHRLSTTLLDPTPYAALDLMVLYPERGAVEITLDEVKGQQTLLPRPLPSLTPVGVIQAL